MPSTETTSYRDKISASLRSNRRDLLIAGAEIAVGTAVIVGLYKAGNYLDEDPPINEPIPDFTKEHSYPKELQLGQPIKPHGHIPDLMIPSEELIITPTEFISHDIGVTLHPLATEFAPPQEGDILVLRHDVQDNDASLNTPEVFEPEYYAVDEINGANTADVLSADYFIFKEWDLARESIVYRLDNTFYRAGTLKMFVTDEGIPSDPYGTQVTQPGVRYFTAPIYTSETDPYSPRPRK